MRDNTLTVSLVLIAATIFFVTRSADAHDLQGLVTERSSLDPDTLAKIEEIENLRALLATRAATTNDGQLEAVVEKTLKWPSGTATVCFFDGGSAARTHVAQVAKDWTEATSLKLDFGPNEGGRDCDPTKPSDIRVSFEGSGYWSYVGIIAKEINPFKQTLNLSGMGNKVTFSPDDDGVILHEFGHAIGFEHEHQSPASGCEEEFNWPYLYVALGWSKDKVDHNMRRLDMSSNMSGLLVTKFDSKSIMLYSLSPSAFKDPATAACFIPHPNNVISSVDREAAEETYPSAEPVAAPPTGSTSDVATLQALKRLNNLVAPDGSP